MPLVVNHWLDGQKLPAVRAANTIHFDSGQLILDAAASEMGVAFMLDTLLADDSRVQPLFNIAVDSPYEYWFVCRQAAMSSKAVRLFHDWLFLVFNDRSEEHTSELQSLMRISYAVFCLKKKKIKTSQ